MTSILVDNFGGESPRIDSRLLPPNGAQIAKNCDLRSGKIVPDNEALIEEAGIPVDTKTIYFRHISGLADGWRTWSNLTYYFESPFGILLQDLTFEAPTETIVATSIDRNDTSNTTIEITCKGSSDAFEEEAGGTTLTTTFDGIYCVGSANPSNNIVNGNAVTFDYNIKKYSSIDGGVTYSLDSTDSATYTGNILYAGADTMYFNPAISATHTSGSANSIKLTIDAEDNLITAQSTGDSLPPAGEILDRYYVFTYVYTNGEESPPSEVSNLATIYKGDQIQGGW